jgi:hypothetical protein
MIMGKLIAKSIEIHCEEEVKRDITEKIIDYLSNYKDWFEGNILVDERFETVEVIFFEGCENVDELMEVLSF